MLHGVSVRNNVQRGITNRPVDLIATRLSRDLVLPLIDEQRHRRRRDLGQRRRRSASVAAFAPRRGRSVEFSLSAVSNLRQDADGKLQFKSIDWQAGLPLQMFEDPNLAVPGSNRAAWLSQWHTDTEWLEALHRTHYSNGFVGLA